MNKKKYLEITALFLIFIVMLVSNTQLTASYTDSDGKYMFDWYNIAQWEFDVCSEWGGLDAPKDSASGEENILEQITQDWVLTAQGTKKLTPEGTFIYQVGYYIQPTRVEDQIIYKIKLVSDSGEQETIAEETADIYNAFSGYYSDKLDGNYSQVEVSFSYKSTNKKYNFILVDEDAQEE